MLESILGVFIPVGLVISVINAGVMIFKLHKRKVSLRKQLAAGAATQFHTITIPPSFPRKVPVTPTAVVITVLDGRHAG